MTMGWCSETFLAQCRAAADPRRCGGVVLAAMKMEWFHGSQIACDPAKPAFLSFCRSKNTHKGSIPCHQANLNIVNWNSKGLRPVDQTITFFLSLLSFLLPFLVQRSWGSNWWGSEEMFCCVQVLLQRGIAMEIRLSDNGEKLATSFGNFLTSDERLVKC